MPGSVQDLTDTLLAAIDPQGNVLDMNVVLQVVSILERTQVTAEDLKTTRLGKHVNMIRRKIVDEHKSLAKRLKKLVKQWQQLLQNKTPNGLSVTSATPTGKPDGSVQQPSPPAHVSTPKPPEVDASIRNNVQTDTMVEVSRSDVNDTPSTSSPPPQPVRQTAAMNFARNRIKRMHMLSSVKKHAQLPDNQEQQHQEQLKQQKQQQQDVTHNQTPQQFHKQQEKTSPFIDNTQEETHRALTSTLSMSDSGQDHVSYLSPATDNEGPLDSSNLRLSQPTLANTLPAIDNVTSKPRPTGATPAEVSMTRDDVESSPDVSLVVSIPQHLMKREGMSQSCQYDSGNRFDFSETESVCHDQSVSTTHKQHNSDFHLTVSIRTSLLQRVPSVSLEDKLVLKRKNTSNVSHLPNIDTKQAHRNVIPSADTAKRLHPDIDSHSSLRSSRSHIPSSALLGVDGCLGEDGGWYAWTESIPGKGTSVNVLPYVYVDGVDNSVCSVEL